jgi:hypothetical protein
VNRLDKFFTITAGVLGLAAASAFVVLMWKLVLL